MRLVKPGDFAPGDYRGARPKFLQNFVHPFLCHNSIAKGIYEIYLFKRLSQYTGFFCRIKRLPYVSFHNKIIKFEDFHHKILTCPFCLLCSEISFFGILNA